MATKELLGVCNPTNTYPNWPDPTFLINKILSRLIESVFIFIREAFASSIRDLETLTTNTIP